MRLYSLFGLTAVFAAGHAAHEALPDAPRTKVSAALESADGKKSYLSASGHKTSAKQYSAKVTLNDFADTGNYRLRVTVTQPGGSRVTLRYAVRLVRK